MSGASFVASVASMSAFVHTSDAKYQVVCMIPFIISHVVTPPILISRNPSNISQKKGRQTRDGLARGYEHFNEVLFSDKSEGTVPYVLYRLYHCAKSPADKSNVRG